MGCWILLLSKKVWYAKLCSTDLSFWSRESFETSFDSKQRETRTETSFGTIRNYTFVFNVSLLFQTLSFGCFDFYRNESKQIETNISLSTAACGASECVCSTTSSVLLDVYVLRQPLLPFDIPVLAGNDASGNICSTAVCAAPEQRHWT
jgi:hypothetical protein